MREKLVLGISLGLVAFLLLACTTTTKREELLKPTKKEEKKEEAKTVKVNEDLQVGEVRWKVLEVSKTETIEQPYGEPKKANGVFVILKLEAELLGKESGTVDAMQFRIVDSKDRTFEHSTEGETALVMTEKESLFLKQVNPNVPITGYAAFDVAKDSTGLKLKIKDLRLTSTEYGFVELGI